MKSVHLLQTTLTECLCYSPDNSTITLYCLGQNSCTFFFNSSSCIGFYLRKCQGWSSEFHWMILFILTSGWWVMLHWTVLEGSKVNVRVKCGSVISIIKYFLWYVKRHMEVANIAENFIAGNVSCLQYLRPSPPLNKAEKYILLLNILPFYINFVKCVQYWYYWPLSYFNSNSWKSPNFDFSPYWVRISMFEQW